MANKDLVAALLYMANNDYSLDEEEARLVKQAAAIINQPLYTVMRTAYKAGFCDAIARGTQGTNIHITANRHADTYATRAINEAKVG